MTSVGTSAAAVVNVPDDFRESIPESEELVLDRVPVSPIVTCSSLLATTCEGAFVENSGTLGADGMVNAGLETTDVHDVRDVRGDDGEDEVREKVASLDSVDVDVVLDTTAAVVAAVVVSDGDEGEMFEIGWTIPRSFT